MIMERNELQEGRLVDIVSMLCTGSLAGADGLQEGLVHIENSSSEMSSEPYLVLKILWHQNHKPIGPTEHEELRVQLATSRIMRGKSSSNKGCLNKT